MSTTTITPNPEWSRSVDADAYRDLIAENLAADLALGDDDW